jgi:hypothetical protein
MTIELRSPGGLVRMDLAGTVRLDGLFVLINAGNSCNAAARIEDPVTTEGDPYHHVGRIVGGSKSVCIGD